ncbi:MAG TPA: PGF-pre-PGF domain-containing protein [candidate division Zixibacteria bacterium]|nr:PGF-pre-PGF domain-containing protein [candidate division Zixibacteria bacterium]
MRISRLLWLILGFILIFGQANAADVTVAPSTKAIIHGESFSMHVSIDPEGIEISGAQLNIAFNQSLIRVNSITEGDLFKQKGANTFYNSGIINNDTGNVINIFNVIIGRKNVSTKGTFIIINATAIGISGISGINLSNVKISDHDSSPVNLVVNNGSAVLNEVTLKSPENDSKYNYFNVNTGNGGSGGGGGGASGLSGEDFYNIEIKEKYDLYINKDLMTSYVFKRTDPIFSVNITGNNNAGEINVAVEVLRNISSLVKDPPPDIVFKNINIWVGTYGFATPANIKQAEITFRVPRSWIKSNSIDQDSITLKHYHGAWESLPTKKIEETSEWIYYKAETYSFSPYAITGKKYYDGSKNRMSQTTEITESQQMEKTANSNGKKASEPEKPGNLGKYLFAGAFVGIVLNAALIHRIRKSKIHEL